MSDFGIVTYAAITAICYLVGYGVKVSNIDNKWIPLIVGACGGALGVACFYGLPEFADTIIDAIAIGIVSGFASTGINEMFTQIATDGGNNKHDDSETDDSNN